MKIRVKVGIAQGISLDYSITLFFVNRNQSPLDTSAPGSENGVAPGRRNPKRLSSIVANTRLQEDAIQGIKSLSSS